MRRRKKKTKHQPCFLELYNILNFLDIYSENFWGKKKSSVSNRADHKLQQDAASNCFSKSTAILNHGLHPFKNRDKFLGNGIEGFFMVKDHHGDMWCWKSSPTPIAWPLQVKTFLGVSTSGIWRKCLDSLNGPLVTISCKKPLVKPQLGWFKLRSWFWMKRKVNFAAFHSVWHEILKEKQQFLTNFPRKDEMCCPYVQYIHMPKRRW